MRFLCSLAQALASNTARCEVSALRFPRLVALAGLVLLHGCRLAAQAPRGRDWNAWPWMSAQIPSPVELSAKAVPTDSGRAFQGVLIFHNSGPDSVRVRFGSCSFGLRLYRDNSLRAQPLWDNRPAPNAACTLVGHELTIGPDEQREWVVLLGFGLLTQPPAPGQFFATITWRPSNETTVREIAAGSVVIR
jgi:hypothetical protein